MIPPAEESRREAKGWRIDLVIAICALFVSTLATGASWWQSRVVQQQLSAQVWPYLAIDVTTGGDALRIGVTNYGLGPALVRDAVMTVDGRAQHDVAAGIALMVGDTRSLSARRPKTQAHVRFSLSSIGAGSVIRPGETHNVLDIAGSSLLAQRLIAAQSRMNLSICYCSILEQCWRIDFNDANGAPKAAACDAHDPSALHPVGPNDLKKYLGGQQR